MQRWQKRKSQFPIIVLIFFVFVAFSILYNQCNLRQVYQDQSHSDTQDRNQGYVVNNVSFFDSTSALNINLPKKPPVGLDKFSTCNSTVTYSGRRAAWGVHNNEPSGRREEAQAEACDLFFGKWVFDNTSYPLYNESDCPYMSDQLACHKDGRNDSGYQCWRWQPHNGNLKRWSDQENMVCEEIDGLGGMEMAMDDWVSSHIVPLEKKVFFMTMSPTHFVKEDWEPGSEGNCYDEKGPIYYGRYRGTGSELPTMQMVDKVLSRLCSKVSVVNITQLSEYRKDGHPTIYRKSWEPLSPERMADPAAYSDCIHWCLPGVPDVWNESLFQNF